ncbi:hypothetical protein [Escherichia coli]
MPAQHHRAGTVTAVRMVLESQGEYDEIEDVKHDTREAEHGPLPGG